jgi:hypothetical protein
VIEEKMGVEEEETKILQRDFYGKLEVMEEEDPD